MPAKVLAAHCRDIGTREGVTFGPGALDLIVRAGDGSVRDTLSVLDQVISYTGNDVTAEAVADVLGAVPAELLDDLVSGLADGDVAAVLRLVGRVADAGLDLRQFAQEAVEHLRSLFLLQVAPDAQLVEATPERLAALTAQAARMGRVELLRAVELLGDCQTQMRRGNIRLPLEIALAKAALPESGGDAAALAARLDRLERRATASPAPPASARPPPPGRPPPPRPEPRCPRCLRPGGSGRRCARPGNSGRRCLRPGGTAGQRRFGGSGERSIRRQWRSLRPPLRRPRRSRCRTAVTRSTSPRCSVCGRPWSRR